MDDISPNPELMEMYGTDELYLRNLEKRAVYDGSNVEDVMTIEEGLGRGLTDEEAADPKTRQKYKKFLTPQLKKQADTIFGKPIADISQAEWGRLVVDKGKEQGKVDKSRVDASALNLKFRNLEAGRMADTIEHAGGPGSRRARFTRARQYQPYALHPLMMTSMGGGGEMAVEASAKSALMAQSWAKLAGGGPYWAQQAGGMSPPPPQPLPVDVHTQAAQRQLGESARSLGHSAGQAAMATGHGFGQLAQRTGQAAQKALKQPRKSTWLTEMGKGMERFMSQDIQPTPRWGTGMPPAANVNQYGVPIY